MKNFTLLEKALEVIRSVPLCDSCLGRFFASLGRGVENDIRGRALKLLILMEAHSRYLRGEKEWVEVMKALARSGMVEACEVLKQLGIEVPPVEPCYVCSDLMRNVDSIAEWVISKIREWSGEFSTFVVGVVVPGDIIEREDSLRSLYGFEFSESIKSELNRRIGKAIKKAFGKEVDFTKPDITVVVDLVNKVVNIEPRPITILGRYLKLTRGISLNPWICTRCGGRGCPECNFQGKKLPTSVEEEIRKLLTGKVLCQDIIMHAAGREDVDARCIGTGRPVIIEFKKPIERKVVIGRFRSQHVILSLERAVDRKYVQELKLGSEKARKVYRLLLLLSNDIREEDLEKLSENFRNVIITQYTPSRVLHRRGNRLREKLLYEVRARKVAPRVIEVLVECQGGLYVKELATGDSGRTKPSFSEVLNVEVTCLELDVLHVEERTR